MPMYAYKCSSCGITADYLVKFNQPAPACKSCSSTDQEKQLSTGTGFCLMGYGWSKVGMNSKRVGNK